MSDSSQQREVTPNANAGVDPGRSQRKWKKPRHEALRKAHYEPVAAFLGEQAQCMFQKNIDAIGVHARIAFTLLRATKEELITMGRRFDDDSAVGFNEELIQGAELVRSLYDLMVAAQLRYASALLNKEAA
jgi:hypothetical protein